LILPPQDHLAWVFFFSSYCLSQLQEVAAEYFTSFFFDFFLLCLLTFFFNEYLCALLERAFEASVFCLKNIRWKQRAQ
jgi:hypothetical protein